MTLSELLALVSSENPPSLCTDSRLAKAGDIFAAIHGTKADGRDFIDQALTNGAKYIVTDKPCNCKDAEVIIVDNPAEAAGLLAQARRSNPASRLTNLAITGTNGKTTVAFLVRSVIQNSGQKCGLIGTIAYDTGLGHYEAPLTTPDCLAIAEMTEQMLKAGSKYMVIEASSHALYQNRTAGLDFKAAAFTNLAGDHLDYHKTKQDYLAAKTKLFEKLSPDATAVLNKQSPEAKQVAQKTKAKILWYAVDQPADITAHIKSMDITGTLFSLEYAGQKQKVKTPLLGRYNVSNHAAAAGLCLTAGFDLKTIAPGLSALKTIPGRLEKLDGDGIYVIIDYAHSDDALKNVLATLKPLCTGRLTVVFGCGGDRDRTKRPRMAKVAEQFADLVIVTSDNPRTEQPEGIIGEIITGFEKPAAETIIVEPDRKKAIELAVKNAAEDDIILIAGKGHETYQIIGDKKFDFSDSDVARQFLTKRK
jgi:UDP-N-acetylmuramoyl-L-alanyl-D-glutamate--2,6-diaminopimelate ligase